MICIYVVFQILESDWIYQGRQFWSNGLPNATWRPSLLQKGTDTTNRRFLSLKNLLVLIHNYKQIKNSSRRVKLIKSLRRVQSTSRISEKINSDKNNLISGEVDEDLMCQICLQPFVQPIDTPCAHTFCHVCIHNYLKVNPMCPLDRKPLNEMTCSPANLVLKR